MSEVAEVQSGLEGVVAFATEIAEPDKEGGSLRYRGVDIEDLVGQVPYEKVWGLLVDGSFDVGLPPGRAARADGAHRRPAHRPAGLAGHARPGVGPRAVIDIDDETAREQLAQVSVMGLSFVAQSARGIGKPPVPQTEVDKATSIPERFLIRWRGEANPDHVKAIDAYWISAAEHGMNASTFTARVITSTGADVAAALSGAVGALSGPLHGGAPSRVLSMLDGVEEKGDAEAWVKEALDRGDRLMGFGHRVYRAEDPRARVLRETAARDRRAAPGGRRGAGGGRAGRAQGAQARPRAGHQRGVLVRGGAGLRRRALQPVHAAVRLARASAAGRRTSWSRSARRG